MPIYLPNYTGKSLRTRPPFSKGGGRRRRPGDYVSILNLVVLFTKSPFDSPFIKGDENKTKQRFSGKQTRNQ